MHHPSDRITHTTAFVTPVVEHWLDHMVKHFFKKLSLHKASRGNDHFYIIFLRQKIAFEIIYMKIPPLLPKYEFVSQTILPPPPCPEVIITYTCLLNTVIPLYISALVTSKQTNNYYPPPPLKKKKKKKKRRRRRKRKRFTIKKIIQEKWFNANLCIMNIIENYNEFD